MFTFRFSDKFNVKLKIKIGVVKKYPSPPVIYLKIISDPKE